MIHFIVLISCITYGGFTQHPRQTQHFHLQPGLLLVARSRPRLPLVLRRTRRHPSADPFLYATKDRTDIFNLEETEKRLEKALAKTYGQELNLNVEIDPSVIGGVKVQVSGEIIDGSVATRLNQARMQLA